MKKNKRKLSKEEKRIKRENKFKYMTIFINGKQKRIKKPETIEGIDVDDFIGLDEDHVWLLQNEMYEELDELQKQDNKSFAEAENKDKIISKNKKKKVKRSDEDVPF